MRKITILERKPGVFRLRIETRGLDGERQFRYKTVHGTREDAELLRRDLLREGDPMPLDYRASVTFREYCEKWLEKRKALGEIVENTEGQYRSLLAHAYRFFGDKQLRQISRADIEELYLFMLRQGGLKSQPLHARTVRHLHARLKTIFKSIIDDGILEKNPMPLVTQPRLAQPVKLETLTDAELTRLLERIKDDYGIGSVIRFALHTGCRRGEIVALRWGDVDLDKGTVHIHRNAVQTGAGVIERQPKTRAGNRRLGLPSAMVEELRLLYEIRVTEGGPDDYVFATQQGHRRSPAAVTNAVHEIFKEIGLERFTLHDLRHAHATMLLRKRHDPKAVSQRLGHADIGLTLRTYHHVMSEDDATLASEIDATLGALGKGPVPGTRGGVLPGTSDRGKPTKSAA